MKTKDLLTASEAELSPKLKAMKLKELEKHAKNIVSSISGNDYDQLLGELIKIIPTLNHNNTQTPLEEKNTPNNLVIVRNYLKESTNLATNDSAEDENKLTRLTVILMLVISRKFNAILKNKK